MLIDRLWKPYLYIYILWQEVIFLYKMACKCESSCKFWEQKAEFATLVCWEYWELQHCCGGDKNKHRKNACGKL